MLSPAEDSQLYGNDDTRRGLKRCQLFEADNNDCIVGVKTWMQGSLNKMEVSTKKGEGMVLGFTERDLGGDVFEFDFKGGCMRGVHGNWYHSDGSIIDVDYFPQIGFFYDEASTAAKPGSKTDMDGYTSMFPAATWFDDAWTVQVTVLTLCDNDQKISSIQIEGGEKKNGFS